MYEQVNWYGHFMPFPIQASLCDPAPWPKDAYKNEYVGAANNWAGMAVDAEARRILLFVPTGSAGYDFWGGDSWRAKTYLLKSASSPQKYPRWKAD
jgi:quinoprotein glucose dehydrogenase